MNVHDAQYQEVEEMEVTRDFDTFFWLWGINEARKQKVYFRVICVLMPHQERKKRIEFGDKCRRMDFGLDIGDKCRENM